jgi:hypothetical protein
LHSNNSQQKGFQDLHSTLTITRILCSSQFQQRGPIATVPCIYCPVFLQ